MRKRPNKFFIVLSLIMVFMFIIGAVSVFLLNCCQPPPNKFTDTAAQNTTVGVLNLTSTQTKAAIVAMTQSAVPTLTPACYAGDVVCPGAPTLNAQERVLVMMASAESTEYYDLAATVTALAQTASTNSNTSPYDPTLYAQRQATLASYATAAGPATYVLFYMEETRLASEYLGTPSPTPNVQSASSGNCGWMWATQSLPDVTEMAQIALQLAGMDDTTVYAEAYGENCLDMQGNIQSFGAMSTDFYVTFQLDSLTDSNQLLQLYINSYSAFNDGLTETVLPAPLGYLSVTFAAGSESKYVRATFDEVKAALAQGTVVQVLLKPLNSGS